MTYSIKEQSNLLRVLNTIHLTNFKDSDYEERRFDEACKELEGYNLPESLMKKFDDALASSYDEGSPAIEAAKREIMAFASSEEDELPRYLQEFPQFDDKLRMIEGFQDDSWHYDAMPHIAKFLTDELGNYNGRSVKVYQDYLNPSFREKSSSESAKDGTDGRFVVHFTDPEKHISIALLATDSWDEAKECALKTAALESINIFELTTPKFEKKAVNQLTDILVKGGMDVDSIDKFFSEIKMQAISRAESLKKENGAAADHYDTR